jgi:hypothetical protein
MATELTLVIPRSTVWHLHNSSNKGTAYTGSGTPWTVASTTPFNLANNDETGPAWAPTAAPPIVQYSGGPPFASRSTPVSVSYQDVDEVIPLRAAANGHLNSASLLRILRQQLVATLELGPCYLGWKPDGATGTLYYEITGATVQELPISMNTELTTTQGKVIRFNLSFRRSALGGDMSTSATPVTSAAVSSTSFGNSPTSATPNLRAFQNVNGDTAYSGQPLNLLLAQNSFTNTSAERTYIASVLSQQSDNSDAAVSRSTTSTTGVEAASYAFGAATYIGTDGVRPRILFALDDPVSNLQIRAVVRAGGTSSDGTIIYTSDWITPGYGSGFVDTLEDMGTFPVDALRDIYRDAAVSAASNITVEFWIRSTNGASASVKLLYTSVLWYYEFCSITYTWADSPLDYLTLQTFQNRQYYAALPLQVPRASVIEENASSDAVAALVVVRGEFPKARVGASLWVAWMGDSRYIPTETITVTARTANLFFTVRGAA